MRLHVRMEQATTTQTHRNLNDPERWISVIFGTALAVYGLKKRSAAGFTAAAAGTALLWRGATGHCPVYGALGISTAGEGEQVSVPYGKGVRVEESVTIAAAPEKLFSFWRDFENLPRFMHNLESVEVHDSLRSRWTVRGPAGSNVSWEAEIINEIPNELIGWRSVEGSTIDNAGSVHFKASPDGRTTQVYVILRYDPPAGRFGAALSKVLGEDPARNVREDLARLQALFETGDMGLNGRAQSAER
jgi:uncharacterized membrane protein